MVPPNLTHSAILWKEDPVGRGDTGGWAGRDLGWSSVGAGSSTGAEKGTGSYGITAGWLRQLGKFKGRFSVCVGSRTCPALL